MFSCCGMALGCESGSGTIVFFLRFQAAFKDFLMVPDPRVQHRRGREEFPKGQGQVPLIFLRFQAAIKDFLRLGHTDVFCGCGEY